MLSCAGEEVGWYDDERVEVCGAGEAGPGVDERGLWRGFVVERGHGEPVLLAWAGVDGKRVRGPCFELPERV